MLEPLCANSGGNVGRNCEGGYAEYIAVPARSLVALPDDIPFAHAAVMMCSSSTSFHALRKARLRAGDSGIRNFAFFNNSAAGEISIGGEVVNDVAPKDRDIAMVFQSYALFPHLNTHQNVAFGLERKRIGRDEIRRRVGYLAQDPRFYDYMTARETLRFVARFNALLDDRPHAITAMLGLIVYQVTLIIASQSFTRERELGTLEQLRITPLGRLELMTVFVLFMPHVWRR